MFRRLTVLMVLAGAVGMAVRGVAPDIRRYLKIRRM